MLSGDKGAIVVVGIERCPPYERQILPGMLRV